MKKINLRVLIDESEADSGFIFDSSGHLVESYNVDYETNIAAMAGVISSMINDFLHDLFKSDKFSECSFLSENGLIIMKRIDDEHVISLTSKDLSKAAIIKLAMKKIILKSHNPI